MFFILIVFSFLLISSIVHAYVIPTFSFVQANTYSTQIKVYGDPNSSVSLHYGNLASSLNTIGTTDDNGSLSVSVSSSNYNIACGNTAYVSINGIQSAIIPWAPINSTCTSMSLSQTSMNITKGQSTSITATNNSNISVSSNSNSSVVSSNVIGNIIYITAMNYGTASLIVCSNDNANLCGTISITVSSDTASSVTFSQKNIILNVGDNQAITMYGSGSGTYYLSSNSNTANVTANINGNIVNIHGLLFGSSSITICQNDSGCGILYVSVVNGSQTHNQTPTSNSSVLPKISSLSFSVSNMTENKIESINNILTLSFSTNVSINMPLVYIGNTKLSVNGSSNGPYTATYNITGDETNSLPIKIDFTSLAGNTGNISFYLGNKIIPASTTNIPVSVVPTETNNISQKTFITNLKLGSKGEEVSSLQSKLKTLKFYSGIIDGRFGPMTEKSVKAFQKTHKLEQSGNVGPKTRVLLNK